MDVRSTQSLSGVPPRAAARDSHFFKANRSRKNGISDKTKKMGPPRRWMGESIMAGSTLTQSSLMTKTLKPFLNRASGITAKTKTTLLHGERKKTYPARKLVINNTNVEWMPLHSGATSMLNPGIWNRVP